MTMSRRLFQLRDGSGGSSSADLTPALKHRTGATYRRTSTGLQVTVVAMKVGVVTVPLLRSGIVHPDNRDALREIADGLKVPMSVLTRVIREHFTNP